MTRQARLIAPIGPRALVACRVTVTEPGRRVHYDGLFRSTTDAVLDAMDRYPALRSVSAKPRGKQR
ncbi:hypothetical protein CKO44_07685 [Rubrivivax gelatinosus]|nr:hypothetical protein [Rubrivivax gelatinosus]MBZ8142962.1 hypothetical protein [Rubrivivax gelatinosus]